MTLTAVARSAAANAATKNPCGGPRNAWSSMPSQAPTGLHAYILCDDINTGCIARPMATNMTVASGERAGQADLHNEYCRATRSTAAVSEGSGVPPDLQSMAPGGE